MGRLPDRAVVEYIMDLAEQGRPREWIARHVDVSLLDVNHVLRIAGFKGRNFRKTLEEYDRVEQAVEDGWSLSEIVRTYGWQYDTLRRWFPEAGWGAGGSTEAAEYAVMKVQLDEAGKELYA